MMKFATLALLASSAAAFAPAQQAKVSTALNSGLDDLKAVAAKCNPVVNVSRIDESLEMSYPIRPDRYSFLNLLLTFAST